MQNYEVLETISTSNSGTLLKIKDTKSGDVKCLKKFDLSKFDEIDRATIHEADLIHAFDHPNVVKHYENFVDGNWFCVVMEYVGGGDLQSYLNSRKTLLTEEEFLKISCQIVAGLSYVHLQGRAHGDLKLKNILFSNDGLVKIGGFEFLHSDSSSGLCPQSLNVESFSPEKIKKLPFLYESDCWALGCLLYELLSLRKPFVSSSLDELLSNVLKKEPKPLTGWYSPELFEIVDELLLKNHNQRLSTALCVQCPIFAQAFISLGINFQQGNGFKKDLDLSSFYLKLALDASNSQGPGWTHLSKLTRAHKLRKLQRKAQNGTNEEIFRYALSLTVINQSVSGDQSPESACLKFKHGFDEHDPFLTNIYGITFEYGYGTSPKDKRKAMELYKTSAEGGDPYGCFEYAFSLEGNYDGTGSRKKEAMQWYKKAAEAGIPFGMCNYGFSLLNGYDDLPPRHKEALEWSRKSALLGNPQGMNRYGVSLDAGFEGFYSRKKEAMIWYKKSADCGNTSGMNNYGTALDNGADGLPPKKKEAMEWYKKSAEAGNVFGMKNYAHALEIGLDGNGQKPDEADEWYKKIGQ